MKRLWIPVALFVVGACGVPTQDGFDAVPAGDFAVDPPVVTEPVIPAADVPALLPVHPYFVSESGLAPAAEEVVSYEGILAALQTRPEDGSGLRTAISTDTVAAIHAEGPAVVVELTEAFQSLPPEEQRIAAAQIVLTLTDRAPGVRVGFALDGQPVDVPTADSTVSLGGSVSRSDYVALLAR